MRPSLASVRTMREISAGEGGGVVRKEVGEEGPHDERKKSTITTPDSVQSKLSSASIVSFLRGSRGPRSSVKAAAALSFSCRAMLLCECLCGVRDWVVCFWRTDTNLLWGPLFQCG